MKSKSYLIENGPSGSIPISINDLISLCEFISLLSGILIETINDIKINDFSYFSFGIRSIVL